MAKRIDRLRQELEAQGIGAFVIAKPENVFYLTGFDGGESLLVVTPDQAAIVTDSRFWQQVEEQAPECLLVKENFRQFEALSPLVQREARVAFESNFFTYDLYEKMKSALPDKTLVPLDRQVEKLRQVKDEGELALIRSAVRAGDQAFDELLQAVEPGMTERQVALLIDTLLGKYGCSKPSFDTIAVAGPRAALPHGRPGPGKISGQEMLLVDFGGFFEMYAGDMTRTLAIKEVSPRFADIYNRVLEAQVKATDMIAPGVSCREVDAVARECLKACGLAQHFGHGLGHGVGLEIHERPALNARSEDVLMPGMVVTVEPGVYIPGWGGIRIEDVVIVTDSGHEVVTKASKDLLAI